MKHIWLHGIYLSIIGVLSFQLWSKTERAERAFGQIEETIKRGLQTIKEDNDNTSIEIEKQIYTNMMKYGMYKEPAKFIDAITKNSIEMLSKSNDSNNFDIENIKTHLEEHAKALDYSVPDPQDRAVITDLSHIHKLLSDNVFWESAKAYPSVFSAILKQQVLADETMYLNYIEDKVSGYIQTSESPNYFTSISPKKPALIVGEKFEADIYLAQYAAHPNNALSFVIGKDTLPIKDGVGHFEKREKTIGLKTLKAKAIFKNKSTGEIMEKVGIFEYHVLPKCSENCQ
jgi:hypothetical protein